jgi:hypothetical protein
LLPNYTWGNIFDSTIPNWDSSYNPPKPGPGPEPGGETPWDDNPITRIQEGYWTGFGGTTYISSVSDFGWAFDEVKRAVGNNLDVFSNYAQSALTEYKNSLGTEREEDARLSFEYAAQGLSLAAQTNGEIYSKGPETNYTDCLLSMIRYPFDISPYFYRKVASNQMWWGNKIVPEPSGGFSPDIWRVDGYQTGQIV